MTTAVEAVAPIAAKASATMPTTFKSQRRYFETAAMGAEARPIEVVAMGHRTEVSQRNRPGSYPSQGLRSRGWRTIHP